MKTVSKIWSEIPFAHRQPKHSGHCAQIHGHNWSIRLVIGAQVVDDNGFVIDFGALKEIRAWIDANLDHACVFTETDPFVKTKAFKTMWTQNIVKPYFLPDASAEGLAQHLYFIFQPMVTKASGGRAVICLVEVREDSRNSASYVYDPQHN